MEGFPLRFRDAVRDFAFAWGVEPRHTPEGDALPLSYNCLRIPLGRALTAVPWVFGPRNATRPLPLALLGLTAGHGARFQATIKPRPWSADTGFITPCQLRFSRVLLTYQAPSKHSRTFRSRPKPGRPGVSQILRLIPRFWG